MDLITVIESQLENLLNDFTSGTGAFVGSARVIALLALTLGAFMTFYDRVSLQNDTDYGRFLIKILLVGLGISFYGTLIHVINAPLKIISSNVKAWSYDNVNQAHNYFEHYEETYTPPPSNEEYDKRLEKYASKTGYYKAVMNDKILTDATDAASAESGFMQKAKLVKMLVGNPMTSVQAMFTNAMLYITNFIGKIGIVVLNVVRTFCLVVLVIFGIFVIPMSVFPSLGDSFKNWLTKYINVYLWLPISYVLLGIINKLYTFIRVDAHQDIADTIMQGGSATDQILELGSNNLMMALLSLCSIVGLAVTPTLGSWFITASTSQVASKVKNKGNETTKKIAATAGKLATGI